MGDRPGPVGAEAGAVLPLIPLPSPGPSPPHPSTRLPARPARPEACPAHPKPHPPPGSPSRALPPAPTLCGRHTRTRQEVPPPGAQAPCLPPPPLPHARPSPQVSTCGSAPRATPAAPARWRKTWPTAAGPSWRPPSWTAAEPCRPPSPASCGASTVSGLRDGRVLAGELGTWWQGLGFGDTGVCRPQQGIRDSRVI